MKRFTLPVLLLLLIWSSVVQAQKIVRDHYSVSAGLLGAANFSEFRLSGDGSDGSSYKHATGWATGFYLNFPFANSFSLEPQVHYSKLSYRNDDLSSLLLNDGDISYISVPLQFKFHTGRKIALTVGPQVDFFSDFSDKRNNARKEDFTKTSFSIFGGLELFPHSRITLFGRYVYGLSNMDNTDNPNTQVEYFNQNIQAGLKLKLFGKRVYGDADGDGIIDKNDKCLLESGLDRYQGCPIPDSDKDGVNDEVDKCPNVQGLERYAGCPVPDKDNDAINDEVDKCPDVAGTAKYEGCPVPDTDKDGVNDENDKCPNEAGLDKYAGCPVPDRDSDGVNDEEDRCPDQAGVAEMSGCPKIEAFDASDVTFASGKSVLTTQGKRELDIVANFIKRLPDAARINLIGYTDSTGTDAVNDTLSASRAEAAKVYLVSKGIDENRISTEGRGSREPIAENKTPKGRALNRRVEVRVQ